MPKQLCIRFTVSHELQYLWDRALPWLPATGSVTTTYSMSRDMHRFRLRLGGVLCMTSSSVSVPCPLSMSLQRASEGAAAAVASATAASAAATRRWPVQCITEHSCDRSWQGEHPGDNKQGNRRKQHHWYVWPECACIGIHRVAQPPGCSRPTAQTLDQLLAARPRRRALQTERCSPVSPRALRPGAISLVHIVALTG
jgi:hypothetical protein